MKILDRKKINQDIMKKSSIGKAISQVVDGEFRNKAINEKAKSLINCWKKTLKEEKMRKEKAKMEEEEKQR